MNNYAETKRIPLEHATNEELIAAIKSIWALNAVEQAEKSIFWARQQSLLDQMHRITEKIDAMRAQPNAYEHSQVVKRMKLHHEFTRINKKLSALQGA